MKKSIIIIAAIIFTISVSGCRNKEKKETLQPVAVDVIVIDSVESRLTRTYIGVIEENSAISLSFPLGGNINQIKVHEGDFVRQGEFLAAIDKRSAQSAYDAAKATLEQAIDGHKRLKQLYDQGSIAEVKWIEMQTNLEKARSMEEIAKKQLEDCEIYAPISGYIGKCYADAGSHFLPGQPAIELLDISQVQINFAVPENEIAKLNTDRRAKITVPALSDYSFSGQISSKSITSNRISHSYQVKIKVTNNDGKLLPGMVCKISMNEPTDAGYILPAKAIQTRPDGISVWKVQNGTAVRQAITSNEFAANGVLVNDGIKQGDTIIVAGQQKLYDNAKVICTQKVY